MCTYMHFCLFLFKKHGLRWGRAFFFFFLRVNRGKRVTRNYLWFLDSPQVSRFVGPSHLTWKSFVEQICFSHSVQEEPCALYIFYGDFMYWISTYKYLTNNICIILYNIWQIIRTYKNTKHAWIILWVNLNYHKLNCYVKEWNKSGRFCHLKGPVLP